MTIPNQYWTHNRPYTKRSRTDAIAMHWVANPGTSAAANRNYFQNTSTEVSANYIIGLVGEVICCIPDGEVSWCTNQANGYTVSIECCHPDWTGRFNGATYKSMVELTASLCKKYGLHPLKGGVIRHFDVTGKNCPKWFVPKSKGGSDTEDAQHWHKFLADVAAQMDKAPQPQSRPALLPQQNSDTTGSGGSGCSSIRRKRSFSPMNLRRHPLATCLRAHTTSMTASAAKTEDSALRPRQSIAERHPLAST